jgi:hypothetical protein
VTDIHELKDLMDYLRKVVNGYDLVGQTCMSFQYQEALALPKVAKDTGVETVFRATILLWPTRRSGGGSQDAKLSTTYCGARGEATFQDLVRTRLECRGLEDELGLSCHAEEHMVHLL